MDLVSMDRFKGYKSGIPNEYRKRIKSEIREDIVKVVKFLLIYVLLFLMIFCGILIRDYVIVGGITEFSFLFLAVFLLISILVILKCIYQFRKKVALFRLANKGYGEWLWCDVRKYKRGKGKVFTEYGEMSTESVYVDKSLLERSRKGRVEYLLLFRIINSRFGEIYYTVMER